MTDDELDALLSELEAGLEEDVRAALALTAQDFADALDGATEIVAARFSVSGIRGMWRRRVGPLMTRLRGIAGRGADAAAEGIGDTLPDGWEAGLDGYVGATQALLDAVGDRLAVAASQALAEGLNAGEDIDALRARLAAVFTDGGTQLGDGRAVRIAMTEATRAFNAGVLAAAQSLSGLDRPLVKQWITRRDNRVREAHSDANGQLQLLDDPFDVGGVPMQYPGDPTAPAALTVNCRCVLRTATAPERNRDVTADISAAADVHTGAMIALMPTEADAARLVLDGGESADQLHLTLFYLGDAVDWTPEQQGDLISRMSDVARALTPIGGRAFGAAQWNPASDEPAWVWNVGNDHDMPGCVLEDAKYETLYALEDGHNDPELPPQYTPWSPHICAVYSKDAWGDRLAARTGPVTFDRIRVAFAGQYTDLPLTGGHADELTDGPYQVGDRVQVAGEPHEPGQTTGVISEIEEGPAYGITFDGTDMVHKWYVADELMPEGVPVAEPDEQLPQILTWSTPGDAALAFEGEQTGDSRVFASGALYWTGGPWPLQYADQMNGGHDGARLAGAIHTIGRDGSRIPGAGVLYLTQPAGVEAAMLLAEGAPLGVSVDLDDVSLELVDQSGDEPYAAHLATASLLPLPDGGWHLTGETAPEWTASGYGTVGESSRIDIVMGSDCHVPASAFQITAAAGESGDGGVVVETQRSGEYLARITRARIRGATLVTIPAYDRARIVLDGPEPYALAASGTLTAGAAGSHYDRVVRHVRKSLTPVTAADAARFLRLPVSVVRRHLARAARKEDLVRISRGTYVGPTASATAAATAVAEPEELTASATGAVDLPVADRDAAWDGDGAATRVAKWASSDGSGDKETIDWDKYGRAFAYRADKTMSASVGDILTSWNQAGGAQNFSWYGPNPATVAPVDAVATSETHGRASVTSVDTFTQLVTSTSGSAVNFPATGVQTAAATSPGVTTGAASATNPTVSSGCVTGPSNGTTDSPVRMPFGFSISRVAGATSAATPSASNTPGVSNTGKAPVSTTITTPGPSGGSSAATVTAGSDTSETTRPGLSKPLTTSSVTAASDGGYDFGDFKLGYADVTDGTLTIIPRGVFAAQAAMEGARGGVDIPADEVNAVNTKLAAVRAHVDEETGGQHMDGMQASAWTAMRDLPPMPSAWFAEPTESELPPGGAGVNYANGRVFGWVAQAGEPHAGFAKKITIDGLGRIDTSHFLRQRFTLDDGSVVKAGAFTMNVGHHRDGAECETSACQFDDTRTVAGIVTVGMNARGMWFSGAAAPWMSEWDRSVFMTSQPSYHMRKGANGAWQLRAVLSVPVPGHSSPLMASAVVDRSNMALTAAATMAEVDEAVAAADELIRHDQENGHYPTSPGVYPHQSPTTVGPHTVAAVAPEAEGINYDRLADSLVAAMARADQRKAEEAAELEALIAEASRLDADTGTVEGN